MGGYLSSSSNDEQHVIFQSNSSSSATSNDNNYKHDSIDELHQKLSQQAPCFPVQATNLSFIQEPQQFYQQLCDGIDKAEDRIVLCSLYLGTGTHEENIVSKLDKALQERPNLKVTILMDYLRGTRGAKQNSSTSSILLPLVQKYSDERINVHFYHTPAIGPWLRKVLPERFDEVVGVQHMKIYMFDNDMIISGANLSDWYFVDRQDRYLYVQQQGQLCSFYENLIGTVNKFSYGLKSNGNLVFPHEGLDPQNNSSKFVLFANKKLKQFIENQYHKQLDQIDNEQQQDTWVFPVIQMGQLKIRHDENVTRSIIEHAAEDAKLTIGSAYFNLTDKYMKAVLNSPCNNISVLTAAPVSNGFFTAKGVSGNIPACYDYMEQVFFRNVVNHHRESDIKVHEYLRKGWTFHGKGLWYSAPGDDKPCATIIGSSNFGQRSTERDVESQVIIVTQNNQLKQEMQLEHQRLFEYTRPVTRDLFNTPDRRVSLWLRVFTKYVASKFL
jgi:CDP-diacylglycerol--glycerol-3-phosphate 3-phosphatidyltransferase